MCEPAGWQLLIALLFGIGIGAALMFVGFLQAVAESKQVRAQTPGSMPPRLEQPGAVAARLRMQRDAGRAE